MLTKAVQAGINHLPKVSSTADSGALAQDLLPPSARPPISAGKPLPIRYGNQCQAPRGGVLWRWDETGARLNPAPPRLGRREDCGRR